MKSLNPSWEDALEFSGVLGDLIEMPMLFKLYDYDMGSRNDMLGELPMSLAPLRSSYTMKIEDEVRSSTPHDRHA